MLKKDRIMQKGDYILKKLVIIFLLFFCLCCSKKDKINSFTDDLGNTVSVSSVNRVCALAESFKEVAKLAGLN